MNQALIRENDYTLVAEVTAYRRAWMASRRQAKALVWAKAKFNDAQDRLHESASFLADANAYRRMEPRILFDDFATDGLDEVTIHEGRTAFDDPWRVAPALERPDCGWCGKEGHGDHECGYITQCMLCRKFGHEEWFCKAPHTLCRAEFVCNVSRDHKNVNRPGCQAGLRSYSG